MGSKDAARLGTLFVVLIMLLRFILACYDAEKIGVYLVSLVPMITMLLICIILYVYV